MHTSDSSGVILTAPPWCGFTRAGGVSYGSLRRSPTRLPDHYLMSGDREHVHLRRHHSHPRCLAAKRCSCFSANAFCRVCFSVLRIVLRRGWNGPLLADNEQASVAPIDSRLPEAAPLWGAMMRTARLSRVAQMSLEKRFYVLPIGLSGAPSRWGLAAAAGRKNRQVRRAGALRLSTAFWKRSFFPFILASFYFSLDRNCYIDAKRGLTSFLHRPKMMLENAESGRCSSQEEPLRRLWRTEFRSARLKADESHWWKSLMKVAFRCVLSVYVLALVAH